MQWSPLPFQKGMLMVSRDVGEPGTEEWDSWNRGMFAALLCCSL